MTNVNFTVNINVCRNGGNAETACHEEKGRLRGQIYGITIQAFGKSLLGMASVNTERNYLTALRSLQFYNGGKEVMLAHLDVDFVMCYERWLRGKNVCPNTISCYMRSLRSLYNKAVRVGLVTQKNPFVTTYTGNDHTEKRSIALRDISRLQSLKLRRGTFTELSRDIFLFSFYALGMPFVDMAHLRKSQIKGNVMVYMRQKTGKRVRVKIEPCMRNIIDKYARADSDYVFPIISVTNNVVERRRQYHEKLGYYNKILKMLARMAGIKANMTSYTSRHTWASVAYSHNVELPVISKALGHSNTRTTLIYISEVDDHRLDRANKKIIKELCGDSSRF